MENINNKPILKDLNAVLNFASERYANEFINQEITLNDPFRSSLRLALEKKGYSIVYLNTTSLVTTRGVQQIFIANQWFAIASYFVDFCTELLTYQLFFEKICDMLNVTDRRDFAERMRTVPTPDESKRFVCAAHDVIRCDFPNHSDCHKAANFLLRFVTDYQWWHGSKTVNRHDFYISPVLNRLHVVNANAEFLAEIVKIYASDLNLRRLVEDLDSFTIGAIKKHYTPTPKEYELYEAAEDLGILETPSQHYSISISAASLERFNAGR